MTFFWVGAPITETIDLVDGYDEEPRVVDNEIYEKYNRFLHAGVQARGSTSAPKVLKTSFLKKYIFYVKNRIRPVLTKKATEAIINEYTSLRNDKDENSMKKVRCARAED